MKRQSGFSVSEVLISLFLVSLIMTILIQFYLSCKKQYIEAEKILTTSIDVQWVSDLLRDSIRRAGFTPCIGIDQLDAIDHRHNQRIDALQIENQPDQFIHVSRMNEHFAKVIQLQSPTQILVQNLTPFPAKRPLLIADCDHAEVHELLRIKKQDHDVLITLKKPLHFSYDYSSTYAGEFLEERWFIKNKTNGQNALYYQLMQAEEVSPVIHSMQTKRNIQNKRILEVNLGLDEGKKYQLIVAVRGS